MLSSRNLDIKYYLTQGFEENSPIPPRSKRRTVVNLKGGLKENKCELNKAQWGNIRNDNDNNNNNIIL